MPKFVLEYVEETLLRRTIEASTVEEAISEAGLLENWDDCEEESLGTNGVDRAYLVRDGRPWKLIYDSSAPNGLEESEEL